jgi:signal transduction histidine kinase
VVIHSVNVNNRYVQQGVEELLTRQRLFEKLARIQSSISHGAALQEVLDAITAGAGELFEDEIVGLRLIDDDDPNYMVLASVNGLNDDLREKLHRSPTGSGAGGLAITENRLVIMHEYDQVPTALQPLAREGLKAAMAAPVYERGEVAGSLVIASYKPGRRYSEVEQEVLLAFAQHASLALSDAKTVDAMLEAQRSKEMFLAMVSHELKSPLTVIIGSLYTLRKHRDTLDAESTESIIDNAYGRAKELAVLVNRVLEGARAELALRAEEVSLGVLIRDAMKGFDQATTLVVPDIPDFHVRVDPTAVHQILGILVENAVAHSPAESGVSLEVKVEAGDVALSVRNVGELPEGTDPDSLFVPFKRGNDARSEGVGLGLYIASQLADAIGGRIDVASQDGYVEFCLRFPIDPDRHVREVEKKVESRQ